MRFKRRWYLPAGVLLLCLLLFLIPFFWKKPVILLLKGRMLNGHSKAALVRMYRPMPVETLREEVHLFNGGYRPQHFRPGPVFVPGKGMNLQDSLGLLLSKRYLDHVVPLQNRRAIARMDSYYGLLNDKGRWVLRPGFDTLYAFRNVYVTIKDKEYRVWDRRGRLRSYVTGNVVTEKYYEERLPFLRSVYPDGSFHLIDPKGNYQKTNFYDSVEVYEEFVLVCRNKKWGVTDKRGKPLIAPEYDWIEAADNVYFKVRKGSLEGLHKRGDKHALVPVMYEEVEVCTPGTFRVLLNEHYGLLDKKAAVLIEPVYDTLYFHHSPEWIVTGRLGFYALRNTKKLEYPSEFYNWIGPYREEMTVIRNENGYGVLSKKGKVVLPPQYDIIHDFSCEVAVVCHNKQYGVIDKTGSFTLPLSLSLVELYDFHEEVALAARFNLMTSRIQKQYGFVDKKGNTVVPFQYEGGHPAFSNGLAAMKLGGKWGFINKKGERVIPFIYDTVAMFSHGQAFAIYNGQPLKLNTQGTTVQ